MSFFTDLLKRIELMENWWQPVLALLAGAGLIALVVVMHERHVEQQRIVQATAIASSTPNRAAFADMRLTGQAAVVYDLTSGQILFGQNADEQLPLASLTKLITMYAAVETLAPSAPVTITAQALAQEGDFGFAEGETFAFNDLARLTLVGSANDGAEAIAEAAAAKRGEASAALLASAVASAGLEHTYALNGTGLDLSTTEAGAKGSPADVAKLAGALLTKSPSIAEATIEPSLTVRDLSGKAHTLANTNQDVVHVPGILLSKTGYTDLAGGNLVVVFDAAIGHPVAIVVLGSTRDGRFTDVNRLVTATLAYFAGTNS